MILIKKPDLTSDQSTLLATFLAVMAEQERYFLKE